MEWKGCPEDKGVWSVDGVPHAYICTYKPNQPRREEECFCAAVVIWIVER